MNIKESLLRLFGRRPDANKAPELPLLTVKHDSIDTMRYKSLIAQLPRFGRICRDDAPIVTPETVEPESIDFTEASIEEIAQWQAEVKAARDARENAAPYPLWQDLCQDLFHLYHHLKPPELLNEGEYDPRVDLHRRIMDKMTAFDDYARTRELTRDDAPMAAAAVMHGAEAHLKPLLEQDLADQLRQAQQAGAQIDKAKESAQTLEELREQARGLLGDGQPLPDELRDQIKAAVKAKRDAIDKADEIMKVKLPFSQAAHDRIEQMAVSTKEKAQEYGNAPSFCQGFGEGEPVYENPEQALKIAEAWSRDPLKGIAERYGRFDPDMRFHRAKRVSGGQDEIVDVEFSDNLKRITPGEAARLAMDDEDFYDDFLMRFLGGDLLTYETVGEEHVGRGPAGMVVDESSSTAGERQMFIKAVVLAVLNMMRREKRDCFVVAFSSERQMKSWSFMAKDPLDAEVILDMASHFFKGGTKPSAGIAEAERLMKTVPKFKKADVIVITDGEAKFTEGDVATRKRLIEMGVRLHGVGVGQAWGYLKEWVSADELLVHVLDFELGDPSEATTHIATHIA